MKKLTYFPLLIAVFLLNGCKTDDLLTFSIKNQANLLVPSTVTVNTPISIPTPDIQTNSTQEFSNNNTRTDLIKDVKLSSLSLETVSPPNKTFSFLKSISIYISASGLAEQKLAYLDDIPNNVGTKIDLVSTNIKLDEIIKKDKYTIRAEVVTDEAVVQEVEVKALMNFRVTAKIL